MAHRGSRSGGYESAKEVPRIRFYEGFPDDWESLCDDVRDELGRFLESLQNEPLSPKLLETCEENGRFYAHRLQNYAVYWKLQFVASELTSIFPQVEKICILAVIKVA